MLCGGILLQVGISGTPIRPTPISGISGTYQNGDLGSSNAGSMTGPVADGSSGIAASIWPGTMSVTSFVSSNFNSLM